jgi:hypothetical protein
MRRRRKALSMEDLRSARTWSIVMAICWLGAAALRFVEGSGTQPGLSAWLSIATPFLFIFSAVYLVNGEDDAEPAVL